MALSDLIQDDAAALISTDDFGEAVTYKPRSGGTRSITAVVERETLQSVDEDGGETVAPLFFVHVANSSTLGIASTELNCGGDKISFPVRPGKSATDRGVVRLISQDEGMLVLECR